jgi:hypothetical protein
MTARSGPLALMPWFERAGIGRPKTLKRWENHKAAPGPSNAELTDLQGPL